MNKKILIALKNKYKIYIYLILIIITGFYFRTFNINWDNNYYFHPDERAIIMYASPLKLPTSLTEFFSSQSPLNPHFFAYGNFPIYFLKLSGVLFSPIDPSFYAYGGLHIIGRLISALADTGTVIIIFAIGSLVFSKKAGLFAAFLYASSVFPIQLSHFFAVDTILTFFMTITLLCIMLFINSPTRKLLLMIGVFTGFSLATKISSLILLPLILLGLAITFYSHKKIRISKYILPLFFAAVATSIVFFVTQPYTAIDFSTFIEQTTLQSQMGKNPFIFPYTLQYVGKIPYFYELKNIALFGQGPLLFISCVLGLVLAIRIARKNLKKNLPLIFLVSFGAIYFIVFGKFAVGWMRYMLPIYPVLAVFGGYFCLSIIQKVPKKLLKNYIARKSLLLLFILLFLIYPFSFLSIYSKTNTRIQASDWINNNIPQGNTLAIEHWDDALPVYGGYNYTQLSLPLYDPDTEQKWEQIDTILQNSDYIIIASNRLYAPLQKLTDCKVLPPGKCYPITDKYYKDLFAGKRGFKKIAEFAEYPTIPFLNIKIDDQSADESFTVYDHPKILIFKNAHK